MVKYWFWQTSISLEVCPSLALNLNHCYENDRLLLHATVISNESMGSMVIVGKSVIILHMSIDFVEMQHIIILHFCP